MNTLELTNNIAAENGISARDTFEKIMLDKINDDISSLRTGISQTFFTQAEENAEEEIETEDDDEAEAEAEADPDDNETEEIDITTLSDDEIEEIINTLSDEGE